MKVTIELDLANADDAAAYLALAQHTLGGKAEVGVKAKRTPKPVVPVAGNPDGEAATEAATEPAKEPATVAPQPAPAQAAAPAKEPAKAVTLKADAPPEIVALQAAPGDRDTVGKALLKACKPVEEGGLSRAVALGLTEKFRPAGNTEKLVKVGMIPNDKLPELAALVLAEYAK